MTDLFGRHEFSITVLDDDSSVGSDSHLNRTPSMFPYLQQDYKEGVFTVQVMTTVVCSSYSRYLSDFTL